MASAYAAAVFVIVPIDNVMESVFDTPVATIGGKNALSVGLLQGSAGNAVGDFTGVFTAFFIGGFPLDDKSLSDVGEVLKHVDDNHDAFWLVELLMLGILPQGYIYPKQQRPIRDLLRKRSHLVRLRTSLVLSLQNIITRNCGVKVNATPSRH